MKLPKPVFQDADETSLIIKLSDKMDENDAIEFLQKAKKNLIRVQAKCINDSWEKAIEVSVGVKENDTARTAEISISSMKIEVGNLNPQTAYNVRFVVINEERYIIETGPETVFDTAPVDCGPKGKSKKCLIQ